MLKKEKIFHIVNEILSEEKDLFDDPELFLVNIKLSTNNRITVHVDSLNSVKISDCAKLSKRIESKLDREEEDFELVVSSAGLDQAFKVKEQYKKNIGKQIKLLDLAGNRYKGELIKTTESGIEIRQDFKKKKEQNLKSAEQIIKFEFDQIKEAKVIITF